MSKCVECENGLPSPKRCSKCKTATYCGRECQTAHWQAHKKECRRIVAEQDQSHPVSTAAQDQPGWRTGNEKQISKLPVEKPFTAISNITLLHSLSEKMTYSVLIDCLRMKQEDTYAIEQDNMTGTIYNHEKTSEKAFRKFLSEAKKVSGLLPSWWSEEKEKECIQFGLEKDGDFCLEHAVEKADVIKQWNDNLMPMKLRMLAEKVYGKGPGGQNGASMLMMMVSQEQGSNPNTIMSHLQFGT